MKLFTEHPHSVGQTYLQHMRFAFRSGFKMILGGAACVTHGIFPFIFQKTGSSIAAKVHDDFSDRQQV